MNKKLLSSRFYQILALTLILMLILGIRLFALTVIEKNSWATAASNQNTKEITTAAPRGEILDRYGRVIATNSQVFTVTFNVSGLTTKEINDTCYSLVKLFEKNGDEYVDEFPILISKQQDGSLSYEYSFDKEKREWLKSIGLPSNATAEEAFKALRKKYDIDVKFDRYEAMNQMQSDGHWPPINVRSMKYTYDQEKKNFLEKYGLELEEGNKIEAIETEKIGFFEKIKNKIFGSDKEKTDSDAILALKAEDAFKQLREIYSIDENLSDLEARKIFRIREEIKNLGYNKYASSTVATDVSDKTIVYVEENSAKLKGVEISSENVRTYPNGSTLAHVLGYMGPISDYQLDEYLEKGYNIHDLIGKDGIEESMEEYLRGTDGVKTIMVNSYGDYIQTISETEPVAGKDVYLTVDLELQKASEKILKNVISSIHNGTKYVSKYGYGATAAASKCQSGAVVAIDVETGDVLAMASYPTYDPNLFAEGISTKDWASVQSYNPRDPLAPTPLYNNATKTSVQPGSTFKPITSIAALQCGLDPDMKIYDKGYVELGERRYYCASHGGHGYEDLKTGIRNSCNFYFYCIGTNTNWNTGASLGYKEPISINKIMQVAKEFGLGEKTGIEIDEVTTPLPTEEAKMRSMENALWNYLYYNAYDYWPETVAKDEETLRVDIDTITGWIEENPTRDEIAKRVLEKTKVLPEKAESLADLAKYSYFNMASWTTGDELITCIGQGDNSYTPLQMASYAATLGSFGLHHQVSIIKGIEGLGLNDNRESYQINISKEHMKAVLKGMSLVTKYSTIGSTFNTIDIDVAGKTGTAEKDGYINPKDEVSYVKSHLRSITNKVTWEQVEAVMYKLMKENPEEYPTENDAVDDALIEASGHKVNYAAINQFKDTYNSFGWMITLAPADNPKIAVVGLLIQSDYSYSVAPLVRDVIATYFDLHKNIETVDYSTKMN